MLPIDSSSRWFDRTEQRARAGAARSVAAVALGAIALLSACQTGGRLQQAARPGATHPDKPNIVFVLTDDQTASEFAYMPNLKALVADQGVTFPNFLISVSLCCPSRTSILRGQYAHNHGVHTNVWPTGSLSRFQAEGLETSTVATWLQGAGYRTGLVGKYLNGYGFHHARIKDEPETADTYVPPGWSQWFAVLRGATAAFDYRVNTNGKILEYGHRATEYAVDVLRDQAVTFIRRSSGLGVPFFAYIAVSPPHLPATPAPRHSQLFSSAMVPRTGSYDEADVDTKPAYVRTHPRLTQETMGQIDARYRQRLRSLQSVDEMIADLVKVLAETGQLADTYIFVTSDNGYLQGQHRIPMAKQAPYEESINVSMAVRGPGIPAGSVARELAGNIDLAPTFAEIAHARIPDFVDGRSLLPVLLAKPEARPVWRSAFLIEHWPSRGDIEGDLTDMPKFEAVRLRDSIFVEYDGGERELYDLAKDPSELHNLSPTAPRHLVDRLSGLLAQLASCKAQGCRRAEDGASAFAKASRGEGEADRATRGRGEPAGRRRAR